MFVVVHSNLAGQWLLLTEGSTIRDCTSSHFQRFTFSRLSHSPTSEHVEALLLALSDNYKSSNTYDQIHFKGLKKAKP